MNLSVFQLNNDDADCYFTAMLPRVFFFLYNINISNNNFFKVEVKDIYKGVNSAFFFGIHSIVEINKSVCFIYYFNDCEYRT